MSEKKRTRLDIQDIMPGSEEVQRDRRLYPQARLQFLPMLCMQCQEAACLDACPTWATYRAEGRLILVDDNFCIGCRYCIMAYPYEARSYNIFSPREYYSGKGLTEFEQAGYRQHPKFAIEKMHLLRYQAEGR